MATQVQFRRGTTTENNAFTGAAAEMTVDTTLTTVRVHDGTTAGGVALVNVSAAQTLTNKTLGNGNTWQGNAPTLAYGGTGDNLTAVQGGIVYSTDAEMAIGLAGTAGQVLTSGGTAAPIWVTPSSLTVGTASTATSAENITGGSAGYLVYQYDTDDTRFIQPGLTGYVLQSTGASTAPSWVTSDLTIGSTSVTLGTTETDFAGLTSLDGTTGLTSLFTTPTGSVSFLTAASGISIGASTSTTTVNDDLVVTGNLTVNGETTTINSTTLTVDDKNIVIAQGAADSASADGAGITVDGANANITYNHAGTQWELDKPVYLSDTTDSTSSSTGALIVAGGIGAAGNIVCDGEFSIVGDIAVNGGDITTDDATFNIVTSTATTVNIGSAATTVDIGASTGTTSINNNLDVDGDVNVDGGDLTTNQTTFNVINTNATTVNAFGAASDINIGAGTSTVTFADDVEVGGNLAVTGTSTFTGQVTFNGGTITLGDSASDNVSFGADVNSNIIPNTDGTYDLGSSTQEWKDLYIDGTAHIDTLDIDENATITGTLGVAGASTFTGQVTANGGLTMDGGVFTVADTTGNVHTSGTLDVDGAANFDSTVQVDGDVNIDGGDLTTTASTFNLINANATTANIAGAATAVNIGASTGTLTVNNAQTVFDSTDSIQIPVGTTAQRDGTPVAGQIRYNSTLSSFEGYGPGDAWGSLGGVKDVDGDTYLLTEVSAGSDEDTFEFYNAGTNTAALDTTALELKNDVYLQFDTGSAAHPTHSEGAIFYSAEYKAPTYYNDIAGVSNQIGLEEWIRVKNVTGSTITNGTPVYVTGASGEVPTVAPADATTEMKARVIGIATHDIANNAEGVATVRGLVSGIDTSALTAGQPVHVGADGSLQTAAPTAPYFPTDVGGCIVSDATDGYIYVRIQEHTTEQLRVTGNTKMDGNLTIAGDLTVSGTQTITSQANLALDNAFIYMNSGDTIGEANTTFSGSGLDDAYFAGHFEGTSTTTYYVRIDGVGTGTGGVDTFEWSKDNWSTTEATGVDLAATVELDNNITIKFNATTGHTDNDQWSGTAAPLNTDTGWASNRNTGTSGVGYTHIGVVWDTASSQMIMFDAYDPEIEGNIDTGDASFSYAPLQIDGLTATTGSFSSNGSFGGTLTVTGATTLNSSVDINGNLDVSGNITSSSGAISFGNENLSTTGTLSAGNATLGTIGSGAITSTGAISGTSLNVSTGAVTAGSLDISGNADIDGTMEADAYTVNGTALNEYIADTVGAMVSSNSESGISVTYQDTDNTLDFNVNDPTITLTGAVTGSATMTNLGNVSIATTATADPTLTINGDASGSATFTNLGNATLTLTIADDSHNHTTANIDNFTESVQDIAGAMWSSNSESGVSVTYQDTDGTLDINVNDPTITLTGDVTGSATMTNLGNVSISTTVAANSVALGTDTTGNYAADVDAGSGISVSGSAGEGTTFTVSHADTSTLSGAYGSTDDGTKIDTITLDGFGHITGITTGATMDRFIVEDGDGTEVVITNDKEWKFVEGGGVNINWTDTSTGSDADPFDLTFTINTGVTAGTGLTGGGTLNATRTISLSHLGIQNLSDPNDDRIMFWDDSAGAMAWLDIGSGLSLSGTTLSASSTIGTSTNLQINSLGVGTAASGTTGEIRATNQITAFYSDERLKKDIAPIENAIEKVMTLRGVTYHANELAESFGFDTKEDHVGVIAQDVKEVLPEAVKPAPFDRMIFEGTEISKSGEDYMTVQYEKLVPLLIEAMKDQQKQIDELKAKLGE
jgi:hypothetical protein